jgi:hypothetical protein
MITLTTPPAINAVLGGNSPVNYDKMVLSPLSLDPVAQNMSAAVRLSSSTNADMQVIAGTLLISASTGILEIRVEQLDFYRRVVLNATQRTWVTDQLRASQNAFEAGLVSLGVVSGTQANGV